MIVAVMQPYLFPYIGYFQLMHAVDCFVFHDDVQYIKGGWINRNRILMNGDPTWITLPVTKASAYLAINQRHYRDPSENGAAIVRKLRAHYAKAPHFHDTMALVEACMDCTNDNVADFNQQALRRLSEALGITCRFEMASRLDFPKHLKGEERVIAICRSLGADRYINPIGGLDLYDNKVFQDAGMSLRFLRAEPSAYPQITAPHVPFLSIIDVLMFNTMAQARTLLDTYKIVAHAQEG